MRVSQHRIKPNNGYTFTHRALLVPSTTGRGTFIKKSSARRKKNNEYLIVERIYYPKLAYLDVIVCQPHVSPMQSGECCGTKASSRWRKINQNFSVVEFNDDHIFVITIQTRNHMHQMTLISYITHLVWGPLSSLLQLGKSFTNPLCHSTRQTRIQDGIGPITGKA